MEKREQHYVHEQDDYRKGTWAVVTAGNSMFMGRVQSVLRHADPYNERRMGHDVTIDDVLTAYAVTFEPTFDAFMPLRPVPVMGPDKKPIMLAPNVPQMGMGRDSLIITRGLTLRPYPTHIINGAGVLYDFLSQMHESDRRTLEAWRESAFEQSKQAIMQAAGLVAPNHAEVATMGRHG